MSAIASRFAFVAIAAAWCGVSASAAAQDEYDEVKICNEGDYPLSVAVLGVVEYAFKTPKGWLEAWYSVRPGWCQRVFYNDEAFSSGTANVAFAQEGRPRVAEFGWGDQSHLDFHVARFCVDPDGDYAEGEAAELIDRLSPPCAEGYVELTTSATLPLRYDNYELKVPTLAAPSGSAAPPPPPSPRDILNGACLESYARDRAGDMSRWCGCVANNLAGVLSTDERREFMEDAVSFIVRGLDEPMPDGQRNWRLYSPIAACQR